MAVTACLAQKAMLEDSASRAPAPPVPWDVFSWRQIALLSGSLVNLLIQLRQNPMEVSEAASDFGKAGSTGFPSLFQLFGGCVPLRVSGILCVPKE